MDRPLNVGDGVGISLHVKYLLHMSVYAQNGDCSTSFIKLPCIRFHEDTFSIPSDGKN